MTESVVSEESIAIVPYVISFLGDNFPGWTMQEWTVGVTFPIHRSVLSSECRDTVPASAPGPQFKRALRPL